MIILGRPTKSYGAQARDCGRARQSVQHVPVGRYDSTTPSRTMNWFRQQDSEVSPPLHLDRAKLALGPVAMTAALQSRSLVVVAQTLNVHISEPSESGCVSLGRIEKTACVSSSMSGTPAHDATSSARTAGAAARFGGTHATRPTAVATTRARRIHEAYARPRILATSQRNQPK